MAECRYCSEEIFFAWHPSWLRWLPIDPESITGEEALHENRGVIWERHHRRHSCRRRWADETREEARAQEISTPRSESWAHATLFVAIDAPPEVIRAAYKALAMLYHPDHGGDSERMVELNKAYEVLVSEKGA